MGKSKDYEVRNFSPTRRILSDYYMVAGEFHQVMGIVDVDVTDARKRIREIKENDNYYVSTTAWVAKCIAKAVSEDKRFNSFRKGSRKLIIFENIDMSVMIEIPKKDGSKVPYNHTIRNIDAKSVKAITEEIQSVQQKKIEDQEQLTRDSSSKYTWLYMVIPAFFRRIIMKRLLQNPFYVQKIMGTVGLSSFGESVKDLSAWAIPLRDKTLNIVIGGMTKKLVQTSTGVETHEFMHLTFSFDHNIVDGAPCARFVGRVNELMNHAYGLQDISEK